MHKPSDRAINAVLLLLVAGLLYLCAASIVGEMDGRQRHQTETRK